MRGFESLRMMFKKRQEAPPAVEAAPDLLEPRNKELSERMGLVMQSLEREEPRSREAMLCSRVGFLADRSHIENQQIDIIKMPDSSLKVTFKLTESAYKLILEKFTFQERGEIRYTKAYDREEMDEYHDDFKLSNALEKKCEHSLVKVANAKEEGMNSALGLVEITIPGSPPLTNDQVGEEIDRLLKDELGIEEGIASPDAEAEKEYKKARYAWHHKLSEPPPGIEERLTREEVFPNYFSFVEKGKAHEYKEIGPYAIYHNIRNDRTLVNILKAGGLLSSHERFRRGLMRHGMSSFEDLRTGGADSVFTRVITEKGSAHMDPSNGNIGKGDSYIIFEPDLVERTDWYAYNNDRYGTTDPNALSSRPNPREFFEKENKHNSYSNEQMFRTGIPLEKIKAIACSNRSSAQDIADMLKAAGIDSLNGKPIEDSIVVTRNMRDFIAVSQHEGGASPYGLSKQTDAAKIEELERQLKGLPDTESDPEDEFTT